MDAKCFVTAMDIHWSDHLIAQGVWQEWIGNAIAKTINMPYDVTAEDVKSAYLLLHEIGLKGITVYRDGSRHKQVLHMTSENAQKTFDVMPSEHITDYVKQRITNPYIKSQVNAALALKVHDEEIISEPQKTEEVSEDRLCPTCKNNLVFRSMVSALNVDTVVVLQDKKSQLFYFLSFLKFCG